jgi:tetratricopeptide (TPR) repeat protein
MLASITTLDKCYELLELDRNASLDEIKATYRKLARKFHPDLNPGDIQAHQHFIDLNQAYQLLLKQIHPQSPPNSATTAPIPQTDVVVTPSARKNEDELKWQLYYELQSLLKKRQFLKAVVLIEGLAQHIPQDSHICQWQGIVYCQFGYELIRRRDFPKAAIYLKKAVRVDPHNRQLGEEVEQALSLVKQLS